MAQKTENEETEFKVPETLTLCINNCGVRGNPATNNMCQKCFNATTSTSNTSTTSTTATTTTSTTNTAVSGGGIVKFSGEKLARSSASRLLVKDSVPETSKRLASDQERDDAETVVAKREVNRCSGCQRKVGLTGFRCRCGELFCWEHRYSDRHDCNYDYKAAGREAIARENPVVKAAKIVRV